MASIATSFQSGSGGGGCQHGRYHGRSRRRSSSGGGGVAVTLINQSGTPMQATAQQKGSDASGRQLLEVVISAISDDLNNGSGPMARALEGRYGLRTAVN